MHDEAYRAVSAHLDTDPTLGRNKLAELTGYSPKVCRKRKELYLAAQKPFAAVRPFPPLNSHPGVTTYAILNDTHIPFQNNHALIIFNTIAKMIQPDAILLNGDIGDFYQISRFTKFQSHPLADEVEDIKVFLTGLRRKFPSSRIVYIYGNHEHRWMVNLKLKNPEMADNQSFALNYQLGLADLGISHIYSGHPENYYCVPGTGTKPGTKPWYVGHFDKVMKFSAYTAKNLIDDKQVNVVQAHTHRGGVYYKTTIGDELMGYENFCLCNRTGAEYIKNPNWQLGFSFLYVWGNGDTMLIPYHIQETATEFFTIHDNMRIAVPKLEAA